MLREVPGEMTIQSANRFGGGATPDLRSSRGRRGTGILCLVIGLLASALPAWAAEIVEVRVGRHPGFTRVVFELDRAAGYRIERSDPSQERAGLVVSLEARSAARKIDSGKALIEQVVVEPMGARSVARVRLAKDGLRLKEMILTNPPRIVLDVLSDTPPAPVVAKAKPTASKATPAVAESKPAPAPAPRPKQASDQARTPAQQTASATPSRADRAVTSTSKSGQQTAAAPTGRTEPARRAGSTPNDAASKALAEATALAAETAAGPLDSADELFGDDPQDELDEPSSALGAAEALARMGEPQEQGARKAPVQKVARPQPAPTPIEKPGAQATPRPMVAKSKSSDEGGGWLTWAFVAVGAIVLVVGGLFVARRRSAASEGYEDASEDSDGYVDDDDMAIAPAGENPFGGLAGGASGDREAGDMLGGPSEVTVPPMAADDDDTTIVSALAGEPDEEKESESVVFDDSAEGETVMDDMEVISRDQVNESLGGAMPPSMGGVPEEFQQMMAEMSRRMEALESRCDELVDARDRLERQVAAQTEELRVQRAAIARTQRAVRNLGRPEGEEPEATEPALRDPNQPTS